VIGDGRGHKERTQICSNKRSTAAALLERVTIVWYFLSRLIFLPQFSLDFEAIFSYLFAYASSSCLGDWLLITREMGRGRRKGDGGGRGRRDGDGKKKKKG
jgi:hypothetical protein